MSARNLQEAKRHDAGVSGATPVGACSSDPEFVAAGSTTAPSSTTGPRKGPLSHRVVLVGCGEKKRASMARAAELYTGSLTRSRILYASASGAPWFIVSAKHGLLRPDDHIPPYNTKLADLAPVERAAWFVCVAHELLNALSDDADPATYEIELHAGEEYADPLEGVLVAIGFVVVRPTRGLGLGEQRGWFAKNVRREALS